MFVVLKMKNVCMFCLSVLAAILLAINFEGGKSSQVFFGYAPRLVPIYCVETTSPEVAISFDCAWGAEKTEQILEVLKEFDAKATFFMVGFWAESHPDMIEKIKEAGMEIATHSNTHPDMTKISDEQKKVELVESISTIEAASGTKVELFRAPYGAYDNALIETASSLGLTTIQWSIDSLDWKGLSAAEICARVMKSPKNGDIILCHNDAKNVVEALPLVLNSLKNAGFTVESVGNVIHETPFVVDRTGKQIQSTQDA